MFRFRRLLVVTVILATALITAMVLRPSRFLLRMVAVKYANPLLAGPLPEDGFVKSSAKRLLATWVQMSLAAEFADRVASPNASDEVALQQILLGVHRSVLNPFEVGHAPRPWPVLLSGAGFCDQINATVAAIAARRFDHVELFGLYDPRTRSSPHTLGRVWSRQRRNWLYFDAFFARPAIFTRGADRKPHFIAFREPMTAVEERGTPVPGLYELPGWTMSEFRGSFLSQVVMRGRQQAFRGDSVATVTPNPLPPPVGGEMTESNHKENERLRIEAERRLRIQQENQAAYDRLASAFVAARITEVTDAVDPVAFLDIERKAVGSPDDRIAELGRIAHSLARRDPSPP